MYYLIVWDRDSASFGQDGLPDKVEIPIEMADFFFNLDEKEFPLLSSLSFDDYDMFSTSQMDPLMAELVAAASVNPSASRLVELMMALIFRANSSGKNVLFDPFR